MENNNKEWRDRLDQSESPMDTGEFWDSLESKLPATNPGKKKRRFLFWLLLVLIGSGFIGAKFIFDKPQGKIAVQSDQQENAGIKEREESSLSSRESNNSETESQVLGASKAISQNQSTLASTAGRKPVQNTQVKNQNKDKVFALRSSQSSIRKSGIRQMGTQNGDVVLSGNALPSKEVNSENKLEQIAGIENLNILNNAESGSFEIHQHSRGEAEFLPTLSGEISRETNWNMSYVPSFDPAPKMNQKKPGWQYWMDLSYGIGIAQHFFSTSDAMIQSYLDNRSKHESILESRMAVWENRLIHHSGFYVSSGLRYQSHITRFDWSKEEVKMEWKMADGFAEDAQGNQIAMQDSAWQQFREHREIRQHNTISSLDIPVNIGYIMRKKQFSIEIAAGLTANIAQYTSGKQLNMENQPVLWNTTDELTFHKYRTGFGASAMLRASWYPTEYLGIFIQPSFHKDFSSRMISGAGYVHRIDFVNFQAGVAFLMFGGGR